MIKYLKYAAPLLLVTAVIVLSILMPTQLARLNDKSILGVVYKDNTAISPESFQYASLSDQERLYIVSQALGNRNILQSDYAASIREKATRSGRDNSVMSFAYVENTRGPSTGELDADKAMEACKTELNEIIKNYPNLKENIDVTKLNLNPCSQQLYSAVYMLDPQKNVPVWQIDYNSATPPTYSDKSPFQLMEAYVDAESGKLYGFAFRLEQADAESFDPDAFAKAWLGRLGIKNFEDITEDGLLIEDASVYIKYATDGMDSAKTVFTVGFYNGVNEVFIRCY